MKFDKNIDAKIHDSGFCGGFKHCFDKKCDVYDPECKECIDDAYEAMDEFMKVDSKNKIHNMFLVIAEQAYKEGKEHQLAEDFPDIGAGVKRLFEDTDIYKIIMENKS